MWFQNSKFCYKNSVDLQINLAYVSVFLIFHNLLQLKFLVCLFHNFTYFWFRLEQEEDLQMCGPSHWLKLTFTVSLRKAWQKAYSCNARLYKVVERAIFVIVRLILLQLQNSCVFVSHWDFFYIWLSLNISWHVFLHCLL